MKLCIAIFLFLIILLCIFKYKLVEGIDGSTQSTDPLVLAQNNSNAISKIETSIKQLMKSDDLIPDISNQVGINTKSIIDINNKVIKAAYSNFGRDGPLNDGDKLPVIKGNDGTGSRAYKSKPTTSDLPRFPSKF
jgi:hypothetical protein